MPEFTFEEATQPQVAEPSSSFSFEEASTPPHPDSFEGQLAAQGLTVGDYNRIMARGEKEAETLVPKKPARGFFGSLAKGFGHSFEATAKGPGVFTLSEETLKNELRDKYAEQTERQEPGTGGKVGEFVGGLGGVITQAVPIGIAAKKPGIAAMFASAGAYDSFIRAGTRALSEGKSLDDAVKLAKKAAVVGGVSQAAVAAVLPSGAPTSLLGALGSGVKPAAAGVGAVGAQNITERALGLKTPITEGMIPTGLTMGLLPAGGYLASRGYARIFVPRSIQALEQTPGEAAEPLAIPYRVPSSLEPGLMQPAGAATFVVDPAGRTVAIGQLSPREQMEAMRGPRAFVPREEQVRPAQAEPPVIGETRAAQLARQEPEIIQQPEIVPATQAVTAPGKAEAGGEVSFGATAEARGIPSARQGVPPQTAEAIAREKLAESEMARALTEAEAKDASPAERQQARVRLEVWAEDWAQARRERVAESGLTETVEPSGFTAIDELLARARLSGDQKLIGPLDELRKVASAPKEEPLGGQVSFAAPAEAKAVPSARQAAQEQPPGIIKGTALEKWADKVIGEDPRGKTRMGLDPKEESRRVVAWSIKGAALIEQGITNFAQWAKEMVRVYGPQIQPFLRDLYSQSQKVLTARTPPSSTQPQTVAPPGPRLLGQITAAFRPKAQQALPETPSTAGEWLPDLGERAANKAIASEPTGVARIPVLGWIFDPRQRAKTEPERALLTYFYEQAVGQAHVKALVSTFGTRFKQQFPRNETGEFTTVGRTTEGQSLHPSDVFESLQRNPESYRLTPEQRQAFDELMKYEQRARELEQKYGIKESPETGELEPGAREDGAYYTRGRVIGKPKRPGGMGGRMVGARQFFQKARAFESEQQGVNRGFNYPMNVDDRILIRLSRLYKAIGDRRLAQDEGLGGRWGSETGPLTYQESQVFQPAFRSGAEYKIFPVEVAQKLNASLGAQQTAWLKTLQNINDFSKSLTLGLDWGVGQIQGLPTAFRDPKAWAKANATSLRAFGSRDVFAQYVRNNAEAVRELAQFGSGIGSVPEMVAGIGEGGVMSKVPRAIGGAVERGGFPRAGRAIAATAEVPEAFGRTFQTFLDVAKIEKWKARREVTPRAEWPRAIQEIEHELNMGRMEAIGVTPGQALAERLFLLAPSYYRGALGLIGDMAAQGVSGAQARRAMGSYMAGILAVFAAGTAALRMPQEEIQRRLNPSSGNFLMLPLEMGGKSLEVGFGGIMRSFMRLGGNVYKTSMEHPGNWGSLASDKNPFTKWLRGHSAPVPKFAWDTFSGEDYMGEDADMSSLAKGSLPLTLQSWLKREKGQTGVQTVADMAFSFLGLLSWPQSTRNRMLVERNRLAQEQFGAPYENLKIRQQSAVMRKLERNPEFALKQPPTKKQLDQALANQLQRQADVQAGLEKPIRDMLEEKGLQVSGFEPTIKIGPTEVYLTEAQTERYKALIIEEYNRTLKNRANLLRNTTPQRGQDLLNDWLIDAKRRARTKLQLEFNR